MTIFLACQQSPHAYAIPAYQFWRHYFFNGLTEAGHTVIESKDVDWARGLLPLNPEELATWRTHAWNRTVDTLTQAQKAQPVDLVLGYFYPQQIEPGAVRACRALGVPCVNFFCDNVREFRRVPVAYEPFDLHWVPESKALPLYRRAGLAHIQAPMPCWIEPRHRHAQHPEEYGPTFIGSHDDLRAELIGSAIVRGAPLTVRGPGWSGVEKSLSRPPASSTGLLTNQVTFIAQHGIASWARKTTRRLAPRNPPPTVPESAVAPSVFGDDYVRVTQRAKVIVGVNRYPSFRHSLKRPDTYSRLRDIEAPMMGASYLTEWTEGLDQLYELGREIEVYRDVSELVEKCRELDRDASRRTALRIAGQRRALAEHTIARTVSRIAAHLGLES